MAATTTPLTTSSGLAVNPLSSQFELSLSASKLHDRDVMSKSDPMGVVYLRKTDGMLQELGRTVSLYDVDTKYYNAPFKGQMLKLKDQEFLGEGSYVLSEVLPAYIVIGSFSIHLASVKYKCNPSRSCPKHLLLSIGKPQKSLAKLEKLEKECKFYFTSTSRP